MTFTVGGTYSDFARTDAQDFTTPGAGWEARYVFGTRTHLAGEAAYAAALNGLDTLGVEDNALLMANGAEASLRANMLTGELQPYLAAGFGWRHYEVVNTDTNTSDVANADDGVVVPMAVGLSYRYERAVADVRAMYRPAFLDDIVAQDNTALDTFSAGVNLGFEF
jgi:hypothetical protein